MNNNRTKQIYVEEISVPISSTENKTFPFPYGVKFLLAPKATMAIENRNEDNDLVAVVMSGYLMTMGIQSWFTAKSKERWADTNAAFF